MNRASRLQLVEGKMRSPTSEKSISDPAFLRRLVGAASGGMAYLDSDLVFTFCNDVQAAYFGRTAHGIIGLPFHEVVPNNPEFWKPVELVSQRGQRLPETTISVTWADRPHEGEHRFIVSYVPDLDGRGRVRGVFMSALEVTESVMAVSETQRGLIERNKALEAIVHQKDLLLGIVSHELRTPLTTIFGNAHILLSRLEALDSESRTQAIMDIRTEAERINRLVENMLLLARAGAQAPVSTEPVQVDKAISDVIVEHRQRFGKRAMQVSVRPKALVVEAQPEYLRQVLQNLVGNAEKYSPADQKIDIRAHQHGDDVVISILDHGQGIDDAESEIIFQPFYRSARTATTVGGAGIGLAVCKLLVQAQSGQIATRPRRGGGSIFSFTLPSAAA